MVSRRTALLLTALVTVSGCPNPKPRLTRTAFGAIATSCGLDRPEFFDTRPLPWVRYLQHDARRTMRGQATPKSICVARGLDGFAYASFWMIFDPPPLPLPPLPGELAPINAPHH